VSSREPRQAHGLDAHARTPKEAARLLLPELTGDAHEVVAAAPDQGLLLPQLTGDALEVVAQHLAPQEVGRLMRTCRVLADAPRHASWALLRASVENDGWITARESAAERGDVQAMRWVATQDMLRFLHTRTPPSAWPKSVFSAAAKGGHIEALRWLRAQTPRIPLDWQACAAAALGGQLEALRWLRSQTPPCPWNSLVFADAASSGRLDVLQFLKAQEPPCPWDEQSCASAAKEGHPGVPAFFASAVAPMSVG